MKKTASEKTYWPTSLTVPGYEHTVIRVNRRSPTFARSKGLTAIPTPCSGTWRHKSALRDVSPGSVLQTRPLAVKLRVARL
jgi:hypothetical protein